MFVIKHGQSQELIFESYEVNDKQIEAAILLDDFIVYGVDRTYTGRAGDYLLRKDGELIVCFKEVFDQIFRS